MRLMIGVEKQELDKLSEALEHAHVKLQSTTARMLNRIAYDMRDKIINEIRQTNIVRSESLLRFSARYTKANPSHPINYMSSSVGTITSDRFSGLVEQETGRIDPRDRIASLRARRKKKQGKIADAFRLKPSVDFPSPEDYVGKDDKHRTIIMLQSLSRARYKKPFIVVGHDKLTSGLYTFVGQAGQKKHFKKQGLRILQSFKNSKRPIRKTAWMRYSLRDYFANNNWADAFDKYMRECQWAK